jgi:SAM-dependent methyltransferase
MTRKYHVITPMARLENLPKLAGMLEPHRITWHVLIDEGTPLPDVGGRPWIDLVVVPNHEVAFYERCNHAINWFLDHSELIDGDRYCVLNDDDAYEPDFFEKVEKLDGDLIIVSMERGDRIPPNVSPDRAHGTSKIWARPENMAPGRVGVEQVVVSGRVLRTARLPLHVQGDGIMIEQLVKANVATYAPEANVWFNYFEPGRWDSYSGVVRPVYGYSSATAQPLRGSVKDVFRERGLTGLLRGALREIRAKGVTGVAAGALREAGWRARAMGDAVSFAARKKIGPRTFTAEGDSYAYFNHRHNQTWRNERTVEVPIAARALELAKGKRVLEVGNVMAHYGDYRHEVVDKYEMSPGVHNVDVVDFRPQTRYDLIVSVSTIEHVGFDETPRDPAKTLKAIEHLESLLAPGGRLLVTLPLGYNPDMDAMLREGKFPFTKRIALKRVSRDNRWKEVAWEDIRDAAYGAPFPFANAILVGTIEKREGSP